MRDIGYAIKSLQETGALTIPGEGESARDMRITSLGTLFVNVPCDIKITRLFVLGLAFGCMSQAIFLGCIHSMPRSMFKSTLVTDRNEVLRNKQFYDNEQESDSLVALRVFEDWLR